MKTLTSIIKYFDKKNLPGENRLSGLLYVFFIRFMIYIIVCIVILISLTIVTIFLSSNPQISKYQSLLLIISLTFLFMVLSIIKTYKAYEKNPDPDIVIIADKKFPYDMSELEKTIMTLSEIGYDDEFIAEYMHLSMIDVIHLRKDISNKIQNYIIEIRKNISVESASKAVKYN